MHSSIQITSKDLWMFYGMMTVFTAMQFIVQCIELNRHKLKVSSTQRYR